ncbi:UNVERIFIED_ORG: peptide/nickel transport system permease protein [Rhizobium sp. SORGH_AS285]|nr:peptide/nickel transport system permease protein [Rhizobium sp. SORGH_AS_0285]
MTISTDTLKPYSREWLLSDRPASRRQARLGRAYVIWRRFSENRLALLGLGIIIALLFVAIFANVLAPHNPVQGDLRNARLLPPGTAGYLLGTDDQGRDILSRLIHGSRLTLFVVLLVAIIAAPIGLIVGTVSGYAGGWVDAVLMRITDIFLAFPKLVLALALVAALGPGIENAVLAIAVTSWPPYARIARAETMTFRNSRFYRRSEAHGRVALPHRLETRHAALHVVADRACHARYGGHHPHCCGPRFPRPWRTAAAAGVGRDDRVGTAFHSRSMVGGCHAGYCDPDRQPRFQPFG